MAFRLNDGLRTRIADSFGTAFDGGTLAIYTGAQPATAGTAATGTLLATIALPADAFAVAVTGVVSKTGTWTDTVDVSGTAGWGRFANVGDTQRIDVSIGTTGQDINLDSTALVAGGTVTVNTFSITQSAG